MLFITYKSLAPIVRVGDTHGNPMVLSRLADKFGIWTPAETRRVIAFDTSENGRCIHTVKWNKRGVVHRAKPWGRSYWRLLQRTRITDDQRDEVDQWLANPIWPGLAMSLHRRAHILLLDVQKFSQINHNQRAAGAVRVQK